MSVSRVKLSVACDEYASDHDHVNEDANKLMGELLLVCSFFYEKTTSSLTT